MEEGKPKVHIYYDGMCNLCSGVMDTVDSSKQADKFEMNDVTKGNLPAGVTYEAAMRDMHVVDESGHVYKGAQAVLKIFEQYPHLRWMAPIGRLPVISLLADGMYRVVAETRYWIWGRKQA